MYDCRYPEVTHSCYCLEETIAGHEVKYPQFSSELYSSFITKLNKQYLTKAYELQSYCAQTLYKNAMKRYSFSGENGNTLYAFELFRDYNVTYDKDGVLSLYFDRFRYDGGANGSTVRTSDNWKTDESRKLRLYELFPRGFDYMAYIENQVIMQIEEQLKTGNAYYFDDYKRLVRRYFNPENFYITDNGLTVFFQEITIAAHVSGIVTFEIPLDVNAATE